MLLDLSEIVIREGMHAGVDIDQPGVEDPDLVFAAPLTGHLDFNNGGDLVNFDGKIRTTLTLPCSRCLTDVRVPVDIDVEEHFPIADVLQPRRQPEPGEDFDTTVSSVVYHDQGKPILDLDELMRQWIVADIPIQTLCQDACAGLCPQCGANRNETPCECEERPANTPLAALAVLLKNGDGSD
jgi:uncharacterized protein